MSLPLPPRIQKALADLQDILYRQEWPAILVSEDYCGFYSEESGAHLPIPPLKYPMEIEQDKKAPKNGKVVEKVEEGFSLIAAARRNGSPAAVEPVAKATFKPKPPVNPSNENQVPPPVVTEPKKQEISLRRHSSDDEERYAREGSVHEPRRPKEYERDEYAYRDKRPVYVERARYRDERVPMDTELRYRDDRDAEMRYVDPHVYRDKVVLVDGGRYREARYHEYERPVARQEPLYAEEEAVYVKGKRTRSPDDARFVSPPVQRYRYVDSEGRRSPVKEEEVYARRRPEYKYVDAYEYGYPRERVEYVKEDRYVRDADLVEGRKGRQAYAYEPSPDHKAPPEREERRYRHQPIVYKRDQDS